MWVWSAIFYTLLNTFIPILFCYSNQTFICTSIHLSFKYLFALLLISSFDLLMQERGTCLLSKISRIDAEINRFLRPHPDCSPTIHTYHPPWIYAAATCFKRWGRCQGNARHAPVGASPLTAVRNISHTVGIPKGRPSCAKSSDASGNCFRNSEKELEKKWQLPEAGKTWVGPEWKIKLKQERGWVFGV